MKATIYFSEINQLLSRKGINATLSSSYKTNSFRVYYSFNILFVKKEISATIDLVGYTSSDVRLKFTLYGLGILENKAKSIIRSKLPQFITMVDDNELKVDIGNINALKKVGIRINLNDIVIDNSGFNIDVMI